MRDMMSVCGGRMGAIDTMRTPSPGAALLILSLLPGSAHARDVRCECIADTLMGGHETEAAHNFGGSSSLRLKGRQGLALLKFDMSPGKGMEVTGARLYIHSKGRAFTTDKISTIAQDWVEGTARNAPQKGASCFLYRAFDKEKWKGDDVTSVILGRGGSALNSRGDVRFYGAGWGFVQIDQGIVEALISGKAFGLAVWDDFEANNDVYSREAGKLYAPYLVLTDTVDRDPPSRIEDLRAELGPDGATVGLRWSAPPDQRRAGATRYDVRRFAQEPALENWDEGEAVNVPAPAKPGSQEVCSAAIERNKTWFFAVRSSDAAGNTSVISNVVRVEAGPEIVIILKNDHLRAGEPVRATIQAVLPSARTLAFSVVLEDAYGRALAHNAFETTEARIHTTLELASKGALTSVLSLEARASEKGRPVGRGRAELTVELPYQPWRDYHAILWGGDEKTAPDFYRKLRLSGVNASMSYGGASGIGPARHGFPFYCENLIPKGNLYLKKEFWGAERARYERTRDRRAFTRYPCLNDPNWRQEMRGVLDKVVSQNRHLNPIAYNLGDEISATSFANPFDYCFGDHCLWKFRQWLRATYGDDLAALNEEWETEFADWNEVVPMTTDEIRKREFPCKGEENFSPWADHRAFMDLTLADALSGLYTHTQSLDKRVPVGFEGGQAPSAFGGYDWWRLSQGPGWLEPYDIGGSREIIRSFNPAIPIVSTTFAGGKKGVYKLWRNFLHGDRGTIIWRDQTWLKEGQLTDYARSLAGTLKELQSGLCRLLAGRTFEHDGLAIYYSQPSIRAHWMLDSESDGNTWVRRFGSWEAGHSSLIFARLSWMSLLEDLGLQYRFVSYEQVEKGTLRKGEYKVLVLPKTVCLSKKEADEIRSFVRAGGCVIADSMAGTMDEHCRRREAGILDDLFGIQRRDFRVAENNGAYRDLAKGSLTFREDRAVRGLEATELKVSEPGLTVSDGNALAEQGGVPAVIFREVEPGLAVYLNLSVMRYHALRDTPGKSNAMRELLRRILYRRGIGPRVQVFRGEKPFPNCERMVFRDGAAAYLSLLINGSIEQQPDGSVSITGLENAAPMDVTVQLDDRSHVYDVRRGAYLGRHSVLTVSLNPFEPLVFALLPFRAQQMEVTAEARGRTLNWRAKLIAEGHQPVRHVFRLETLSPSGEGIHYYSGNVESSEDWAEGALPLASNDPSGTWTITVRDVATGLSGTARVTVR